MKLVLTPIMLLAVGVTYAVTLDEAVSTALEIRGDVQAARSEHRAAQWQSRGATYWFLPSVTGQISFQRDHDIREIEVPGMGSLPMGSEYTSMAGITVQVPLYVPQGPAGARLYGRSSDLAEARLMSTELDAVSQVIKAFYGVLLSQRMVEVAEEALEIAREGYELAQARYDAGTISRFELLQSHVAWQNRKPEAISARSALETARRGLAVAMGLDDTVEVELEGFLEAPIHASIPTSLSEARRLMETHSPELAMADAMRLSAEAGVDMARSEFLPSLVFQTDYYYQAMRDDYEFSTDDYDRSWSTSISLQIPIFDGLSDISGYNAARSEQLASYSEARALKQSSGLSLVQAWNSLEEARERVESTCATVVEAEEGAEIARVSYEAGMITRLEMDQAFLALTSARSNHAQSLFELRSAETDLTRTMGTMKGAGR
ncbi:hypothetical protein GF402_09850 [Candidatus Fermentibacteria bacterium]|nr:hypothetical protein [Candidatus Fermentibacteria bacterium]